MSFRNVLWTAAALVAWLAVVSSASAQYDEAAWTDFAYAYDFDSPIGSYDLDANGSPDFTDPGIAQAGGAITINNNYFGSDASTGVWHTNIAPDSGASGYTLEFRAKVINAAGSFGAMEAFMTPAEFAPATLFGIGSSSTYWSSAGVPLDESDNSDDFHTFRVTQLPASGDSATYHIWRDGELIGINRAPGYTYPNPAFWVGCGSGRGQGETQMEYFALTPGVYVPVGFEFPTPDPIEDMAEQASDSFAFAYEMDVDPTDVGAIDVDSNGVADFSLYQSGTPGTAAISGNGTYVIEALEEGSQCYITSSVAGEAWPDAALTAAEGYTVEYRLKVNSQVDETSAPFGIGMSGSDTGDIGIVTMTTDNTNYYNGPVLDESGNSDDFHTMRIVRDTFEVDALYWVWRDGVLMTPEGVGASAAGSINSIYLGDLSGSSGGNVEIDYLRFTAGKFAPVDWTLPADDLPGDLNGDGAVGSADLDIVRANWGTAVTPGDLTVGDADGDGSIGSGDLDIVRANWGQTAAASVPEPSTLLLLLTGMVLIRRRR